MSKFTDKLKIAGGMYIKDPNKVIATNPANSYNTRLNGIWNQIQDATPSITSTSTLSEILGRLERLELENKFLRLKIASMEGKFSQEEVTNIRKMMMSADEASVLLANTIIENA
jgi:hypothetical protein